MRGSRIPTAKRVINSVAPLDPSDLSEANANNLMFLYDNIGTGEYLEDAAILTRHVKQLFAREQVVPNLTLEVLAGTGWFSQNTYVTFAGGNSPSFTAPVTNPRIDILTLRNDGTLQRLVGTEAASPVAPTIPSTDISLAQVYNVVGQTVIHDNDAQVAGQGYIQYDLRPFVQVAVGSSAMPKIGLVARTTVNPFTNAFQDLVNYTGSGRLLGADVNITSGQVATMRITIDGVVFADFTSPNVGGDNKLTFASGATTNPFALASGAAAYTELAQGVFFKSSLRIQVKSAANTGLDSAYAQYEHE